MIDIRDENGLLYRKSLVNQGDSARIKKVMRKALQGLTRQGIDSYISKRSDCDFFFRKQSIYSS